MLDGDRRYGKVESEEGAGPSGWVCCFIQGVQGGLEEKVTCDSRPEEGVSVRSSCVRLSSQVTPRPRRSRGSFPAETTCPFRSAGDLVLRIFTSEPAEETLPAVTEDRKRVPEGPASSCKSPALNSLIPLITQNESRGSTNYRRRPNNTTGLLSDHQIVRQNILALSPRGKKSAIASDSKSIGAGFVSASGLLGLLLTERAIN